MNPLKIVKNAKNSRYTKKIVLYAKKNSVKLKILLLAAICGAMIVRGIMQQPEILDNKAEIQRLNEEIEYEKSRQEEVENMRENVETDEYIERIARDKLGLVKQNEKVFMDVSATE